MENIKVCHVLLLLLLLNGTNSRNAMEQDKLVIVFKNISQKEIYARWPECQKYSHRITKQPFLF